MRVAGNIAFRGRFQSWLQDEYRFSNRAPPQYWIDRACKRENCSTCAKCPRCRVGLCVGGRWEKEFEGCSKCTHCNKCVASGNDDNDNDNDTLREVPHPSNEGLALQARVSGPWHHKKESVLLVKLARWQGAQVQTVKRQNVVQRYLK